MTHTWWSHHTPSLWPNRRLLVLRIGVVLLCLCTLLLLIVRMVWFLHLERGFFGQGEKVLVVDNRDDVCLSVATNLNPRGVDPKGICLLFDSGR